jgi:hypothetical protein
MLSILALLSCFSEKKKGGGEIRKGWNFMDT